MKYPLPNSLYDCVLDDNKVYLLIIYDLQGKYKMLEKCL